MSCTLVTDDINQPIVSVNIMGGLGNQLFQVCSAYAYAKKMCGRLQIKHITTNGKRPLYFDSILKRFNQVIVSDLPTNMETWSEQQPTQYLDIGPLSKNGKYLKGYLQSSKYFYNDTIKQEIRTLLVPDRDILQQIKQKYLYLISNVERVVIIHCRRTDYITAARYHGPLQGGYYKQAISKMLQTIKNPIFILCGDDNTYWSEISNDISDVYKYEWLILPPETDINTFIFLQQFQNYIISNSTFIWWTVWLSNARNVIAPSKWFGPGGPSEYEDIYEPSWHRI